MRGAKPKHPILTALPGLLFTLFVYGTLPLIPVFWEFVFKQYGPDNIRRYSEILFAALFIFGGIAIASIPARDKMLRLLKFLFIGLVYAAFLQSMELTSERAHLIEYGILSWLYSLFFLRLSRDTSAVTSAWALAFAVGVGDEWIQYALPNRVGVISDTYLNGISAALGLALSRQAFATDRLPPARVRGVRMAACSTAFAAAVFGAFVPVAADFGFKHRGSSNAAFYSHFTLDELHRKDSAETEKYLAAVQDLYPVRMHAYLKDEARTDKFAAEFLVHLFRRDRYADKKDYFVACGENRILTDHFPQVLAGSGHAWQEERLSSCKGSSAAATLATYSSPVAQDEIIASLAPLELAAILAAAIGLALAVAIRPEPVARFFNKDLVPDPP